ncbi:MULTISPECIES: hypothetical protein [unclassified Streptomyces]|uniref:hypothetical protein n=1 Tax=Streptomyces TaxID=1883 RepID=UPI000DC79B9E|nr:MULTISPECIES: hypothetical protein [unclassified Streptomyces]AWZ06456.1 hypothetical protein DRB89_19580 [Streptomyces sp. ICC4]AWZ13171.1 hypothetical protein DRB96_13580 [Streptomyces sp. ICC1]
MIRQDELASTPLALDVDTGLLDVAGRRVRPAVVWVRHGSACALLAQARPAGSMTPLRAESWSGFLRQVASTAAVSLPGGTVLGPGQLAQARALGVRTPRTVVTNDVPAGAREVAAGTLVVKTPDFRLFEPERRNWKACLPAVVGREAAQGPATGPARGPSAGPAPVGDRPVVVQEYVAHARELRVYHLDGGICAFEVDKPDPSSLMTDPDSVTVTRVDCPRPAAEAVRTLCAAWSLRYGAFDLLVSDTGEPVFLEANPDGDWLWFERKARWHGVSFMAAVMVRESFVRSTS